MNHSEKRVTLALLAGLAATVAVCLLLSSFSAPAAATHRDPDPPSPAASSDLSAWETGVFTYPLTITLTIRDTFGPRLLQPGEYSRYDFHRGIDWFASEGTLVRAVTTGTVRAARGDWTSGTGSGNYVHLLHEHVTCETRYNHLLEIYVAEGETVTPGQIIGRVGDTGATYPHLHFEVRQGMTVTQRAAIHPLSTPFLPWTNRVSPTVTLLGVYTDAAGLTALIEVTSPYTEPDVLTVAVAVAGAISDGRVVDFAALNAATAVVADLDDPCVDDVCIAPVDLSTDNDYRVTMAFRGLAHGPTATVTAQVFDVDGWSSTDTAFLAGGLEVTPADQLATGAPGERVALVYTLTNHTGAQGTFSLGGLSAQGWLTTINPVTATLEHGASVTVTIAITLNTTTFGPSDCGLLLGASQGDPQRVAAGLYRIYRDAHVSAATGGDTPGCGSTGTPCTTIGYAIDWTDAGGTVRVARGIYTENLTLTKTIHMLGGYATDWITRSLVAYSTTVDGGGSGAVLVIDGDYGPLVEGFTFFNGHRHGGAGGGVRLVGGAAPTLRSNWILSNTADKSGGGIYVGPYGTLSPTIAGNTVAGNTSGSYGGGIYVKDRQALIQGNVISGNDAAKGGGGIYLTGGTTTWVFNNGIQYNTAGSAGSGIRVAGDSAPRIYYNTLVGNQPGSGVGLYIASGTPIVVNNIVADHAVGVYCSDPVTVSFSVFSNTTDLNGSCISATNVVADPLLSDDGVHLLPDSPAIDAGTGVEVDGDASAFAEDDIDGEPRPMGGGYDIGADEFSTGCFACLNDTITYPSIQAAVDASTHPTDVVKVVGYCAGVSTRAGVTQVVYISKTVTVRGGYTHTNWTTPNSGANPTTVDAQGQGRGIYVVGGPAPGSGISVTVAGLRIIGGDATGLGGDVSGRDAGGGMYVATATVTLGNDHVFGNTAVVGGGVMFFNCPVATLVENEIYGNRASYRGGGLAFRYSPSATLLTNTINGNEANHSGPGMKDYGGVWFDHSDSATLIDNTVSGNNAANTCGGACFSSSHDAVLVGNVIVGNTRGPGWDGYGVGVYLRDSRRASLTGNTISSNTGEDPGNLGTILGGGLYVGSHSSAELAFNAISSNTATRGGGLYVDADSKVALASNTITGNAVYDSGGAWYFTPDGGGLYASDSTVALTNTIIAGNQAEGMGSGVYIGRSSVQMLHTTIAHNGGGDGSGVCVTGATSAVALTNAILVSHTVGITVAEGSAAVLDGVLFHSNAANYDGGGAIAVSNAYTGSPAFVDAGAGNYHIALTSAAIDRGVPAGVNGDVDGDPRPQGNGYDLGADETGLVVTKWAAPDPVQAGAQLTYTICVTNTSDVDLQAAVTDTLPAHTAPGGLLTWAPVSIAARDSWTETIIVTVERGYGGLLTNVVQVAAQAVAEGGATGAYTRTTRAVPLPQLLAFQPQLAAEGYWFTVRIDDVLPHTRYVISSYHHTDIDYLQDAITVTTDGAGVASVRVRSRCEAGGVLTGTVFVHLAQAGVFQAASSPLDCAALQTVGDFGSHLAVDSANDDWIYRPSPPGADGVRLWVRDAAGRTGLTGTLSIRSTQTGYSLPVQTLVDEGGGLYSYVWPTAGLPRADDYRVRLTLRDGAGGLSGVDAFVKLSGRATWTWGEAAGEHNPPIWAILTNQDYDGNGIGDRDGWLSFCNAPYGQFEPYATTSYLSVYPYINYTGTSVTETFQVFLTAAHGADDVHVEALAGTYEWVESDGGLQDGKDLCDAILNFNRVGATPAERFDGIHYDVEHDDWFTNTHWARFIALITYCQTQVDLYNQTHEPIVFGVDVPPRFLTGAGSSNAVTSAWDVLDIVDYIILMDYRDFAGVRWDGSRTDGIIFYAEPFVADGNALGKPVVIGVDLTAPRHDHVTFFEECPAYMEEELRRVSRHFAGDWAYKGIAIHDYEAWKIKDCGVTVEGPTRGVVNVPYTFTATVTPISTTLPITYTWRATGQSEKTTTSFAPDDAVTFTWNALDTKIVTVTVTKATGVTLTDTHLITIAVPDAPRLISPADGAVISDTTPVLTWQASHGAAGYRLNWSGVTSGVISDVGNVTRYTTTVLSDGVYTWTVAAYDALGHTSPYTDVWSFTVDTTHSYVTYLPLVMRAYPISWLLTVRQESDADAGPMATLCTLPAFDDADAAGQQREQRDAVFPPAVLMASTQATSCTVDDRRVMLKHQISVIAFSLVSWPCCR